MSGDATAATPNKRPICAGVSPRYLSKNSGSTGSSIAIVDPVSTMAAAQSATAGTRTTRQIETRVDRVSSGCGRTYAKPAAHTSESIDTTSNGNATPPAWYNQPPIDGPTMMPKLVPDIT